MASERVIVISVRVSFGDRMDQAGEGRGTLPSSSMAREEEEMDDIARARACSGEKRETADGECPGVVESKKDVGRLREATGRGLPPSDPSISEWGNPREEPLESRSREDKGGN